jgi:hypothetical protein
LSAKIKDSLKNTRGGGVRKIRSLKYEWMGTVKNDNTEMHCFGYTIKENNLCILNRYVL